MLRVLADQERHGYEIKKQVERILGGRSINNNVLYPALRKFEADLGTDDRLRILRVRRGLVEARIAHMESLRPDAQAEPWGLRVMDFGIGRYRDELAWLDALKPAAAGGG